MATSKRKLVPSRVEYALAEGSVAIRGGEFILIDPADQESGFFTIGEDKEEAAAVFLALAKHMLDQLEPTSAQELFQESGLAPKDHAPKDCSLGPVTPKDAPYVMKGNEGNERKEMNESKERATKLSKETERKLMEGNVPSDEIRYLSHMSGVRSLLETSFNPVAAAQTILSRPKHQKAFPVWLKNHPAPQAEPSPVPPPPSKPSLEDYIDPELEDFEPKPNPNDTGEELELAASKAFEIVEDD